MNKMENTLDEPEAEAVSEVTQPISAVSKETRKIMKHIVIPGAASVSAVSIGSVLLFSRTMYNALAMLLGLGLGSQRLDPATLLEYWENESRKRTLDDRDQKVDGMFG